MPDVPDPAVPDPPIRLPADALAEATKAITELERSTTGSTGRPARLGDVITNVAVGLVCVLCVAALVVHTMLEPHGPAVDEITALLLGVLLIAPFVRHLRVLEIGSTKVEFGGFQANTRDGLKAVLDVLKAQQIALRDLVEHPATVEEDVPVLGRDRRVVDPGPAATPPVTAARPLRRVLWVSAHPEATSYETGACRRIFDVRTVPDVDRAIPLIGLDEVDAVVRSTAYDDDRDWETEADRLLGAAGARTPAVPVFFYTSPDEPDRSVALVGKGAVAVTTDSARLLRVLRARAREAFDSAVLACLVSAAGRDGFAPQETGADWTARLDDATVLVDTPHWLTPQTRAVDERYRRLSVERAEDGAALALLVTQKEILTAGQRARAPDGVEPLTIDELPARLARFRNSAEQTVS